MSVDAPPLRTCRSCGKPIRFAESEHGNAMPLDAEPTSIGSFAVELGEHGWVARHVKNRDRGGRRLYISHHATCEHADEWRGARRR